MSYAACQITSSLNLGCASSVGGIRKAYIVAGSITGQSENASGAVTGVTGTGDVYTFEVQKQTSSLAETFNISLENGTTMFQQDTTLVFHKMDTTKRDQLKLLSYNRGIQLFVEDNNGTIFGVLGIDFDGGFMSSGSGASGTAFGDSNQYQIVLSTYSKAPASILGDTLSNILTAAGMTLHS